MEDIEDFMQSRQTFILLVTILLIITLLVGFSQSAPSEQSSLPIAQVENVRDYRSAIVPGGPDYAVDGGRLYVGHPGYWVEIPLPADVIASAVDVLIEPAVDAGLAREVIYVGAANQLSLYRTDNRGETWQHGKLTHDLVHQGVVGGITDIAVDPVQRLIYAGTDTAGMFRVRDTGAELKSSAQLLLDEPVVQVVTDRQGSGLTFLRTEWHLYRGEDYGLNWQVVDSLQTIPTALAIAETQPAALLLGTAELGVLRSEDGITWTPINRGLMIAPPARLHVDALAVDPIQPNVAYVAISRLSGNYYVRHKPDQLAYTRDSGATWETLEQAELSAKVTELLPVIGQSAADYALTATSRTPQALGNAPAAAVPALVNHSQGEPITRNSAIAWIIAGLAALALGFALIVDLLTRPEVPLSGSAQFEPRPVRRNRWS